MNDSINKLGNFGPLFDTWLKSVHDFSPHTMPPFPTFDDPKKDGEKNNPLMDFWENGMQTWQAIVSAMTPFSALPNSLPGIGAFQETFLKMTQPVFKNITQMFQRWQDKSIKSVNDLESIDFEGIETEIISIWKKIYDTEFRKFFQAPQFGLMREHQEKLAGFMDHFNILQSTLAEFLSLLANPLKETGKSFHEKLADMARKNESPSDVRAYYRIWLKILEGHYMTLFQSPDYVRSLSETLSAAAAYTQAKKELVGDLLQQFSIPSSEHMDAVYRELHELKKRLRDLEKK